MSDDVRKTVEYLNGRLTLGEFQQKGKTMSDPPIENFHQSAMSQMIDDIRFWSYCTWKGMEATCPEKKEELQRHFANLNISPWVSEGGSKEGEG